MTASTPKIHSRVAELNAEVQVTQPPHTPRIRSSYSALRAAKARARERLVNKSEIDWRYWTEAMAVLKAEHAGYLMVGIDPWCRPNPHLWTRDENRAAYEAYEQADRQALLIIQAAKSRELLSATPLEWAEWGSKYFKLHYLFEFYAARAAASKSIAPATTSEPEQPTAQVAAAEPAALETRVIARLFEDLPWPESAWRRNLASAQARWLTECLVVRGQRGVRASTWHPVRIADRLADRSTNKVSVNQLKARFRSLRSDPDIRPWINQLECWAEHRLRQENFGE